MLRGHPAAEQQRLITWMDLNAPYYGTSSSRHPDLPGCRRLYPSDLDAVLAAVAARRCVSCHASGVPRRFYTRVTARPPTLS
ncbi:MAG: hypothetical protein IT204_21345 [Fimbriimonadaceae bacterium]|nr:hypothetical protein [Fimbriimonadaceae bacterium]